MPFTEANGKRFFFHQAEPAEGVQSCGLSVLAVHGLGSTHSFYLPIIPDLTKAGLTCFAYDTYGSGLSVLSDQQEQSIESMAQDALAIMKGFNLTTERTVLIGHSLGGSVACYLASKHLFAAVVLLGPVHPNPVSADVFAKRIGAVSQSGMEALADIIPKAATGSKSTPLQQAWIRTLLLSQPPDGYMSLCRVIADAIVPEYRMITSPVLLVAGAEDKSPPRDGSRYIIESCGTTESAKHLEVLDGVGHWHCVEAPDEIARLIVHFVTKMGITTRGSG